jgi:hypothetical protein
MQNAQTIELHRIAAWSQFRLIDNERRPYNLARGISNTTPSLTLKFWLGGKRFRVQAKKKGALLRCGGAG